jgi:flagellin-like protein
MNSRKILKNVKALSPVVASIILIAATVAVSVAVAAWMGGMSIGLMNSSDDVSIISVVYPNANSTRIIVQNSGATNSSLNNAFIDGVAARIFTPIQVPKASSVTITLTAANFTNVFPLHSGTAYTIKLITAKGTTVISAPTTYNP